MNRIFSSRQWWLRALKLWDGLLAYGDSGCFHRRPPRARVQRYRYRPTFDELERREVLSPIANPAAFSVLHGRSLNGDLTPYAYDPDGDPVSFRSVQTPAHGTLSVSAGGTFLYQSDFTFAGTDTFTYQVSDGIESSDPATVTITVTNSPPSGQPAVYSIHHGDILDTMSAGLPSLLTSASDADNDLSPSPRTPFPSTATSMSMRTAICIMCPIWASSELTGSAIS